MKIDLGNGYFLRADSYQWIVSSSEFIDKNGKTYFRNNWYFGSLEGVVRFLINRQLRESECADLSMLIAKLEDLSQKLTDKLNIGLVPTLIDMRRASLFTQGGEISKN